MQALKRGRASKNAIEADVKFIGLHSHEEPDQLVAATEVPDAQAIHTELDPKTYGADGLWNQQLFVGGSPAECLKTALENGIEDPTVPMWWEPFIPTPGEGTEEERLLSLRAAVFKNWDNKTKLLFRLAKSAEELVTATMHEIEQGSGGQLIGIDFRLKQPQSIIRKLACETCGNPKKTVAQVMNTRMTDTLRYTLLYPTANYCAFAHKMIDILVDEKGFESFELRCVF